MPTATHSTLSGADLHPLGYEGSDPGSVGAGKYWINTTVTPHLLSRRNAGNSAWVTVGASGGGSGVVIVTSLPTAGSTYRSLIYAVQGATGVADVLYVCEKNESDAYVWVAITPTTTLDRRSITWSTIAASPWWSEFGITMTGVLPGDRCTTSPESDPGNVTWVAYCKTANTVTIRVASTINASTTPNAVYWKTTWETLS